MGDVWRALMGVRTGLHGIDTTMRAVNFVQGQGDRHKRKKGEKQKKGENAVALNINNEIAFHKQQVSTLTNTKNNMRKIAELTIRENKLAYQDCLTRMKQREAHERQAGNPQGAESVKQDRELLQGSFVSEDERQRLQLDRCCFEYDQAIQAHQAHMEHLNNLLAQTRAGADVGSIPGDRSIPAPQPYVVPPFSQTFAQYSAFMANPSSSSPSPPSYTASAGPSLPYRPAAEKPLPSSVQAARKEEYSSPPSTPPAPSYFPYDPTPPQQGYPSYPSYSYTTTYQPSPSPYPPQPNASYPPQPSYSYSSNPAYPPSPYPPGGY